MMPGSCDLSCNLADADPAVIAPNDALQSTVASSEQDSSYADACIRHWINRAVGLAPNGGRIVLAGDGRGNLLLGGPGNDTLMPGMRTMRPSAAPTYSCSMRKSGRAPSWTSTAKVATASLVDASLTWTVESNSLSGMTTRFCDGTGCCSQVCWRPGSTHTASCARRLAQPWDHEAGTERHGASVDAPGRTHLTPPASPRRHVAGCHDGGRATSLGEKGVSQGDGARRTILISNRKFLKQERRTLCFPH